MVGKTQTKVKDIEKYIAKIKRKKNLIELAKICHHEKTSICGGGESVCDNCGLIMTSLQWTKQVYIWQGDL